MTDEERRLMQQFGITTEAKTVYLFKDHKYERLQDALNYAQIDTDRDRGLPGSGKP